MCKTYPVPWVRMWLYKDVRSLHNTTQKLIKVSDLWCVCYFLLTLHDSETQLSKNILLDLCLSETLTCLRDFHLTSFMFMENLWREWQRDEVFCYLPKWRSLQKGLTETCWFQLQLESRSPSCITSMCGSCSMAWTRLMILHSIHHALHKTMDPAWIILGLKTSSCLLSGKF